MRFHFLLYNFLGKSSNDYARGAERHHNAIFSHFHQIKNEAPKPFAFFYSSRK